MFYGEKFKLIRKAKRIPLNDVATAMEKHRKTIWAWETQISTPSPTEIKALAKLVDVDLEKISDIKESQPIISKISSSAEIGKDTFKHLSEEDRIKIESIQDSLTKANAKIEFIEAETENYKTILSTTQTFVYTKNKDLNFMYTNPLFLKYLKIEESITGKNNTYIFPEEEAQELDLLEKQVLEGRLIQNQKIKISRIGRETALFSGQPIIDRNTHSITGIAVSLEEITERTKAIEKHKILETALNSMEEILWIKKGDFGKQSVPHETKQKLVPQSGTKNESCSVYLSGAVENLTGYSRKQIFDNPEFWANSIIHPEDATKVTSYYRNEDFSKPVEYRIITNDGDLRLISEAVYIWEENNLMFIVIKDVTSKYEKTLEKECLNNALKDIKSMVWVAKEIKHSENAYKYEPPTDAIEGIFGCSKQDFVKQGRNAWVKVLHPDHTEIADIHVEDFKNEQFPLHLEYKVIKKKRVQWIREKIYKKNGMLWGLVSDISNYKKKSSKPIIKTN